MFRNFIVLLPIVRSVLNVVFSHTVGSFAKIKLDPDNALKVAFAKLYQTVKKDIGDIRQEKIDMCDIHAVGKMAGKLSAERDTFMKEKEEYLESIQSKLRKLLFEEIALEDARKMYN